MIPVNILFPLILDTVAILILTPDTIVLAVRRREHRIVVDTGPDLLILLSLTILNVMTDHAHVIDLTTGLEVERGADHGHAADHDQIQFDNRDRVHVIAKEGLKTFGIFDKERRFFQFCFS